MRHITSQCFNSGAANWNKADWGLITLQCIALLSRSAIEPLNVCNNECIQISNINIELKRPIFDTFMIRYEKKKNQTLWF